MGLLVGLAVGFGGAWLMRRAALPSSGLYPLAVLCLALLAYGASAGLHASGFAAIYVAALVLGNSDLPHRTATRSFAEGVAWLAQIGLFVMLGLLLTPSRITPSAIAIAVAGGLLLTFVARPVTVVGQLGGPADAAGARPRSCPGRGCAGRCRSCSPPSRSPKGSPTRSGSSTSSS